MGKKLGFKNLEKVTGGVSAKKSNFAHFVHFSEMEFKNLKIGDQVSVLYDGVIYECYIYYPAINGSNTICVRGGGFIKDLSDVKRESVGPKGQGLK